MNDTQYNKQRKRIMALIEEFQAPLGFNWFRIDHEFYRDVDTESTATGAKTLVSWEYMQASIEWRLPVIAELSDDKLRSMFFHEFAHVLTGGLMSQIDYENDAQRQIMEHTAELVGRTIEYAIDHASKPKTAKAKRG